MLAEAESRGLPGVSIQRVKFQRAGEGYPLDDVIVHGTTHKGDPAVLEVQVKRTITFASSDPVFKKVVEQLAQAFLKLDLSHEHHQLAVATEKTSFRISGPYQDVLRWAREVNSASTFIERIKREGVGNSDMRAFVKTVRSHLATVGCANDDESVWHILCSFQILVFDYDAPGSQSHELALERSQHVLEPDETTRASGFWEALTEIAIRVAASGGDLDCNRLRSEPTLASFRVRGSWRNLAPRATLAEAASLTAADLQCTIAGVTLFRSAQFNAVRNARDEGRYIEIRGGPGVGKSGILGMLVQQTLSTCSTITITNKRNSLL
ncbi:hypothetical protein AGMMS50256_00800 [Betaproteobacteria bacterium]|nr:hypothetical protein AGMMS50256_00800 [Betaproteobacteria bacterium]